MNKGLIGGIIGVVTGGAIGSAATALIFKKKYKDVPTMEEVEGYINDEVSKAIKDIKAKLCHDAEPEKEVITPAEEETPKEAPVEKTPKATTTSTEYVDYHNAFQDPEKKKITEEPIEPPKPVGDPVIPKTKPKVSTLSELCTEQEAFDLEDNDDAWVINEITFYKGDHIVTEGEGSEETISSLEQYGIEEDMLNTTKDLLYFKNNEDQLIYSVVIIPESYEDTH